MEVSVNTSIQMWGEVYTICEQYENNDHDCTDVLILVSISLILNINCRQYKIVFYMYSCSY